MTNPDTFKFFKTSREIIRLAVMLYVRFSLSLRNAEDLLHERGIEISHEAVRFWCHRFGPMLASDIRQKRAEMPFRRRERAMQRFRRMRSLQMFAAVHASLFYKFNSERSFYSRANFKLDRSAALVEWRQLGAA